ncbi:unnamed protein product [Schistosoma mattheei]|uniref:Uncharacterized protein n=1 Tax=Schistosoma mattheei TaxID=31246 RepID=A0A3P8D2T4_9TREM|nr:unnamed protein product [Schistosoma mattheei]
MKFTPVNVDLLPLDLLSDSQNKTIHELLSHNESCKFIIKHIKKIIILR